MTVSEDGDLHIYKEDKRSNHTWTFMLKTEVQQSCFDFRGIKPGNILPVYNLIRLSPYRHV